MMVLTGMLVTKDHVVQRKWFDVHEHDGHVSTPLLTRSCNSASPVVICIGLMLTSKCKIFVKSEFLAGC